MSGQRYSLSEELTHIVCSKDTSRHYSVLWLAPRALCAARTRPKQTHSQPGSGWEQLGMLRACWEDWGWLSNQRCRLGIPGVHHSQIFQQIFLVLGNHHLTIWTHLLSA